MIASVIREAIAPVLRECPRECGIVAITSVKVSGDLTFATVWVSALREPKAAITFLESQRSALQKRLVMLQSHRIPKLRFRIDDSSQRGSEIDALLERASKELPDDSSSDVQG